MWPVRRGREMTSFTRRTFMRRSAEGATLATLGSALGPIGAAIAGASSLLAPIRAAQAGGLADSATLERWARYLAQIGTRHTGGADQAGYIDDLEAAMRALGWQTDRRTQHFTRWDASAFGLRAQPEGETERELPAAYYYPYSGSTPAGGIDGELAYAGGGAAADFAAGSFAGKIAVIDVAPFDVPIDVAFETYFGLAPGVDGTLPYDRSWIEAGPSLAPARAAGAVGALIILPEAPADAEGQYAPFKFPIQHVPALNLDAEVGGQVRRLAQASGNRARLTLQATVSRGHTDSLLAVLPGPGSDVVVVNTHTDGTNLIEEDGGLAMVSIAQRLSAVPRARRPCTFAFYFATGHFAYGVTSSGAYVTEYPELFRRTKAGVTIEHLGCPEYLDNHSNRYYPTGKPELSAIFSSNATVAGIANRAIKTEGVTRCDPVKPEPVFFGEGAALDAAGIPMMSYIAGPDYLLAERDATVELARFDVHRMNREIKALYRMITSAASTPRTTLAAK